jgi:Domain of unknown function (DUF4376)
MVTPVYDPLRQYVRYLSSKPIPTVVRNGGTDEDPIFETVFNMSPEWEILDLPQEHIDNNLATLRSQIWEQIKTIRDTRTQTGGYAVSGNWFHSDLFSRSQQIGLTILGANVPANLYWKTMAGSFVLMTQTLAGQIFQAAAAQDIATFAHAEALKAQVYAAEQPSSVNINAGWPIIYGE